MKLKYYLRGLGIGIVVTALLMGVATKDNGVMSDEEIKARAAELGMVEQRTLADMRDNAAPTEEPVITDAPAITEAPVATEEPSVTEEPIETQEPAITDETVATEAPMATEKPVATEEPVVTQEPVQGVPEATQVPDTQVPIDTATPEQTTDDSIESQPSDSPADGSETLAQPTAENLGDRVRITIYAGNHSESVSKVLEEAGLVADADAFDWYLRENGYSRIVNTGIYEIPIGTPEDEIARIITKTNQTN